MGERPLEEYLRWDNAVAHRLGCPLYMDVATAHRCTCDLPDRIYYERIVTAFIEGHPITYPWHAVRERALRSRRI